VELHDPIFFGRFNAGKLMLIFPGDKTGEYLGNLLAFFRLVKSKFKPFLL